MDNTLEPLAILAANACKLSSLKLLILDVDFRDLQPPFAFLEDLSHRKILSGDPDSGLQEREESPKLATGRLSSFLKKIGSTGAMNGLLRGGGVNMSLQEAPEEYQNRITQCDDVWSLVQMGKQQLLDIWNGSRSRVGLDATEIRVVSSRGIDLEHDRAKVDFYRHAKYHEAKHLGLAECSTNSTDGASSSWDSPWADQDVFSLVETKPWLAYYQMDEHGCLCWTGLLPRNSNPNAIASSTSGDGTSLILPPLIKLETQKPRD